MKRVHKKIRIKVEDMAHLRTITTLRVSRLGVAGIAIAVFAIAVCFGGALIMLTPLHTLLPGYLKEEQRYASEENLMRLDSINRVYEQNQAFIDNFLHVTDTERNPVDSLLREAGMIEIGADSLTGPSEREQAFVRAMDKRERYNISVLAPLAADGMIFYPVTDTGMFTGESRDQETGEIVIPRDGMIMALADGRVIDVYYSPAEKGHVISIQHGRGFISRYAGTGIPLAGTGDAVTAGQLIAAAPDPDSKGQRKLRLRMWHNTHPVCPYIYVGDPGSTRDDDHGREENLFESPRGKF